MDIQTALICGGVAAFSAVVIYVISVFSMREKTYEEAIAEQRKLPEENLLLGRSVKDKAKDKKQKKMGKKVKEKSSDHEKSDHNDLQSKPSSVQSAKREETVLKSNTESTSHENAKQLNSTSSKSNHKDVSANKSNLKDVSSSKSNPKDVSSSKSNPKDVSSSKSNPKDVSSNKSNPKDVSSSKSNPKDVSSSKSSPKDVSSSKSNPKDVSSASNKPDDEKISTKVDSVSVLKSERVQTASKEEKELEKKKDNAKQDKAPAKSEKVSSASEKVSPKTDKATSKPEKVPSKSEVSPKPEKNIPKTDKNAAKSEKPVANKIEKVASSKTEKVFGKNDKATVEKTEKVVLAKAEKPANAKSDKGAAKQDNSGQQKGEKTSAKQEKNMLQDAPAAISEVKEVAPTPVPSAVVKLEAPVSNAAPPKEKSRKKKSELATLQQMSGERDGVNMSLLLPIVQKAELSRSEIQILIDHLLNKQQNAGASDAEWIEGRQDPVVKLKKQLAEKEKALSDEQEILHGVQAKLKEVRQEFNAERSRLSHNCRQLEEALVTKSNEAQALAARLQHSQDAVNNEKQSLNLQVQQLQQKLTEEHGRLCQLQEQEGQLQQELLGQRQQMERHMAHLTEQESALKAQVAQLMAQVKEQESVNASLNLELQGLRDSQMSESNLLHERATHAEKQLLVYKESVERAQELAQQVEELSIIRGDLEHRLSAGQQHETSLQYEINNLRKDLEDMQAQLVSYEALKNDSNRLRSENDKLTNQLHQFKDLQLENQRLHEDNERLSSQLVVLPQLQKEALQLREENENLAAQVTAMTERPAAEGRENGDIQFHEEKRELPKGDFTFFEKTIQQKEGQVMQLSAELEEKSSLLKQLQSEINTYKTDISKLNSELDEQRRKNNEISQKIHSEQQIATKQLLQRIFPEIKIEDCKNYDRWLEQFESSASQSLSELRSKASAVISTTPTEPGSDVEELEKQNAHLQGLITNYKTIIDDTAGMLKQLQNQVEEGEIRWRQQLQVKEAELEAVRQELGTSSPQEPSGESTNNLATQSKVEDLQAKLKINDQEKQDLESKYTNLTSSIEQLKQERDGLSIELKKEQDKSQDLSKELVRLRSLVQIGKDSLNQEHEMVVTLQQQVDKLNGVHQNHTVASNGPSTESPVAQGGSGKK